MSNELGFFLFGCLVEQRFLPALQDILERSVRELGAIRLIDSRIGVPGQLARNPG
jgi:hypothetical protein